MKDENVSKCPMKFSRQALAPGLQMWDCEGRRCAWWDKVRLCCAIVSFIESFNKEE